MYNEERRRFWLDGLATGDKVAVRQKARFGPSSYYLTRVTRTTPTQISVVDPYGRMRKFRRVNGRQVGETYGDEIEELTADVQAKADKAAIETRYRSVAILNERDLTTEERAAMLAAYDAIHTKKATA